MAIKLKLTGFDDLLNDIQKSGGSIDKACETTMKQSAKVMETELKSAMTNANVSPALINRMPKYELQKEGNRYTAKVGYRGTQYNEKNISDYHEAIFLNYGTPKRTKHGKIKARGFVAKAKKRAKPQIKAQQKETLEKILNDLKG